MVKVSLNSPLKIDLHAHLQDFEIDKYKPTTISKIIKRNGLDIVVLSRFIDHIEPQSMFKFSNFVKNVNNNGLIALEGVEVETNWGHILGVGIPAGDFKPYQDIEETIERIHQLGGIVIAPHPFLCASESVITKRNCRRIISSLWNKAFELNLDAVEVYNSSMEYFKIKNFLSGHKISKSVKPFDLDYQLAKKCAKKLKKPIVSTSDAHGVFMIGENYSLVQSTLNKDDIIESLRRGKIFIPERTNSSKKLINFLKFTLWYPKYFLHKKNRIKKSKYFQLEKTWDVVTNFLFFPNRKIPKIEIKKLSNYEKNILKILINNLEEKLSYSEIVFINSDILIEKIKEIKAL